MTSSGGSAEHEGDKAGGTASSKGGGAADKAGTAKRGGGSLLPAGPRHNPYEGADLEAPPVQSYSLQNTFKVGRLPGVPVQAAGRPASLS
jgi:hypothetical protein